MWLFCRDENENLVFIVLNIFSPELLLLLKMSVIVWSDVINVKVSLSVTLVTWVHGKDFVFPKVVLLSCVCTGCLSVKVLFGRF